METLKQKKDFQKVFNCGKSIASKYLVLYWNPNKLDNNRYGFSISKRIGKAVVRNKLKRRLKEIIRTRLDNTAYGYDIIIIARKPVNSLGFSEIKNDLKKLYKRAGLIDN
ncbi:MAG: ribonuclease P protein component [Halanaerobiales bacterium]|nr:ribonuclease P protein component [Halanaerobiales bacterium]